MDKFTNSSSADLNNANKSRTSTTSTNEMMGEELEDSRENQYIRSLDSPEIPKFSSNFGQVNREFMERIKSRQHEEWD